MTTQEIVAAALELPREAREEVIRQLLLSIDPGEENLSPEKWEKAWAEEVDRRIREMREGKVKGIPAADVFASGRAFRS